MSSWRRPFYGLCNAPCSSRRLLKSAAERFGGPHRAQQRRGMFIAGLRHGAQRSLDRKEDVAPVRSRIVEVGIAMAASIVWEHGRFLIYAGGDP